jgi:hypothetical protein
VDVAPAVELSGTAFGTSALSGDAGAPGPPVGTENVSSGPGAFAASTAKSMGAPHSCADGTDT